MTMRPIRPMAMPDVQPGATAASLPEFDTVDPRTLMVDEAYQRNLSERSVNLIRRIVAGWDWRAFKPPICVQVGAHLHVVDGQHTAIAAVTHPDVAEIPVMIIQAEDARDRASAFVKHNRDRISVTPLQLHYALVAAGDEDAVTVEQVCSRAGAKVLRLPPGEGRFKVGETLAISTIRTLCRKRGAMGARQVLQCCVEGMLAPISMAHLKAVEEIFFGEMYRGQVLAADLSTTIRQLGPTAERDGMRFAAEHNLPAWKGLTVILFRNAKKGRRHGSREAA
jgi:hypothetical protein